MEDRIEMIRVFCGPDYNRFYLKMQIRAACFAVNCSILHQKKLADSFRLLCLKEQRVSGWECTEGGLFGGQTISSPATVSLVTGVVGGLEARVIAFRGLDGANHLCFFHLAGLDPHGLRSFFDLLYGHCFVLCCV